jgi:hypothetical protein
MADGTVDASADTRPTLAQRALVLGALGLLAVGGLGGIEAWPLTAWRLFSQDRGPAQSGWALETVDAAGGVERLGFGQLPVGHRMATWRLGDAVRDPAGDGPEVCGLLLVAARDLRPDTEGLRILRDRQRMVEGPDGWTRVHDPQTVLTCGREAP